MNTLELLSNSEYLNVICIHLPYTLNFIESSNTFNKIKQFFEFVENVIGENWFWEDEMKWRLVIRQMNRNNTSAMEKWQQIYEAYGVFF